MQITKGLNGRWTKELSPVERDLYTRLLAEMATRQAGDQKLTSLIDAQQQAIRRLQERIQLLELEVSQLKGGK